ncbi:MAG: tryptophan--tRNA ligase [Bacteroidales bacterium]|nr:tryptophan--tRNA ligase [Bacteroidales bacterium]
METIVSGIRPTGNLHLGNHFGAIRNFLKLQEDNDCYFFIADYHSLTTHPKPQDLHGNVKRVLVHYLAAGLDPDKATLYVQSQLPETAELYLLLNMNAYLGELQRVASFKEKARQQPDNINVGLLTYPTLMTADVIIHRATKVPVGKDQQQHLEMARNFVNRFNRMYEVDFFPEPFAYNFGEDLIKIPGLDGSTKMGKSEGEANAIYFVEDPKVIRKKIMRAVTDSGPTEMNQTKPQYIENLFNLLRVMSSPDTVEYFDDQYNKCEIRYGDLKKQLAEDVIKFVTPYREKIEALWNDEAYLQKVVKQGTEKAHASASKTMNELRKIIGFLPF